MRYSFFAILSFALCGAASMVVQAQAQNASAKSVQNDTITVAFNGRLSTFCRLKPDADPATRIREVTARELKIATVEAGGATIHLDWSRSRKILNELIFSSLDLGDGGPNPSVQAKITGQRVWVLSAARACLCPSDSESALQLALKAELKVTPDFELIDGRWPSILEKQHLPFVSHAALKGYNDVMWTEIEHRHGKGARQRVEQQASEMEPMLRNEK
jgi:hypothetical protein